MKRVLEKTANAYGVPYEEVEKEIHKALMLAMGNQNESNREIWNLIAPDGDKTPTTDTIAMLAKYVVDSRN